MFGPGSGFLVLWSANPRAKRTGLDSIPCSPITWIAAEPARYNKSHVLFGVGRWELPLLSSFRPVPRRRRKKKKIPFPQVSLAVPCKTRLRKGVAKLLINSTNKKKKKGIGAPSGCLALSNERTDVCLLST